MTEYVEIQCAACHHEFVVKSKAVGQKCKCPDCGQMSDVSENLPLRKKPGWGTLLVASLARFRLAGAMLLLAALGVGGWLVFKISFNGKTQPALAANTTPLAANQEPLAMPVFSSPPNSVPDHTTGEESFTPAVPEANPDYVAGNAMPPSLVRRPVVTKTLAQASTGPQVENSDNQATPATKDIFSKIQNQEGFVELDQALERFKAQDLKGTMQALEEAKQQHPELPPPRYMLAELYLAINQLAAARAELERVAQDTPDYAGSYVVFGKLALLDNHVSDADLQFQHALQLLPNVKQAARRRELELGILAGICTVNERRQHWAAVEQAARRWISLDEKNAEARQRLARSLVAQEKIDLAINTLQAARKNDAEIPVPELLIGTFWNELGNFKKAEEWLQKAMQAAPQDAKVIQTAASWMLQQNRLSEAFALALKAEQLESTADRKLLCGLIARHQKNYVEAETWLDAAHQLEPANFAISNQLVLVLAAQADAAKHRRAVQLAEVNVRQFPRSADALSSLGWAYYCNGQLEPAERALQSAASGGRVTSEIAYYLAHVMADRGRIEDVTKLLKGSLSATGNFLYREEAQQWYNRITAKPK